MKLLRYFVLALLALPASAQFTTVTGTVTDPNSVPYANGTITATLNTSASPTLSGFSYQPPTQPAGLNAAGTFLMQLADNTVLLPGGTTWTFKVCSAAGTVQPVAGKGPVCFIVPSLAIAGASQSITAQLTAAAPSLTLSGGSSQTTINNQTANYQLVLADAGALVRMNVAGANTVTIAPDATTNFPVGSAITVRQIGAGQTTIVAGGGVTISTPSSLALRVQNASVQMIKVAANTWDLIGDTQ